MLLKFIRKLSLMFIIVLIVTIPIGKLLDSIQREIPSNKLLWVNQISNSHYNDVLLGSSRTYMMFDSHVWYEETGRSSINLGLDGSGMADHYLTLLMFLNNGNRFERLFIQLDESTLQNSFSYPFRDYVWSLFDNEEFENTMRDNLSILRYYKFKAHPFFKYLIENKKYSFRIADFNYNNSFGTYISDTTYIPKKYKQPKSLNNNRKLYKFDLKSLKYFNKLVDLCDSVKVEIIVYTAPIHENRLDSVGVNFIDNGVRKYLNGTNVDYINLIGGKSYADSLHYRLYIYEDNKKVVDFGHLNSIGSKILTKEIAKKVGSIKYLN